MARVEIYTKKACPFCDRAKQSLHRKQLAFEEYSVDSSDARKAEMVERTGGRTIVPQIFIGGRQAGGCDDLMGLVTLGKLDATLAEMSMVSAPLQPAPKLALPDGTSGGAIVP